MAHEASVIIAHLRNTFGLSYAQIGMMIGLKEEPGRTIKQWSELGPWWVEGGETVPEAHLEDLNKVHRKMMRLLALFDFDAKRCRREIRKKVRSLRGQRPLSLMIRGDSVAVIEYYEGLKRQKK